MRPPIRAVRSPFRPADGPAQPDRLVPGRHRAGRRRERPRGRPREIRSGPAAFHRLGLLRVDDTVEVTRKDRRAAVFAVDSVRVVPKRDFPDALGHGPTERAELRLITCGGKLDRKAGQESDTVVFAHLTGARWTGSPDQYDFGRPRVCWAT
ncbi:sortase domain-bontaining protein [Kitasatospora sp. NPDC059648]|uniref:sortase domain-containing protein n=1 Tax=Kitasatospora sp. NPDC059648 TaxID=3346894 RepID=UPI0036A42ED0